MNKNLSYFRWRYHKLNRRLIRAICSKFYHDADQDINKSMLVAGTGRSGTTWLASIIASQIPCRVMFEPFHSRKVKTFHQFHYFHYMNPSEQDDKLYLYSQKIFSGDIKDRWIDRQVENLFPKYRLVKEIRANLFLNWIHLRFPEIPLIFIIRHPCAVVASRLQLKWASDSDIEPFLAQPKLIEDFLKDKLDVIRQAKTVEEKHALIWCISNLIPLKQFERSELNVIFYENLVLQPEIEIPRIFRAINLDYTETVFKYVSRPSTTSIRSSAIVTGSDKVSHWKNELSPQQITNILAVVKAFDLDYIYGEAARPLIKSQ